MMNPHNVPIPQIKLLKDRGQKSLKMSALKLISECVYKARSERVFGCRQASVGRKVGKEEEVEVSTDEDGWELRIRQKLE